MACNIYSLRFELRTVPRWMHSEPVDPNKFMHKGEVVRASSRNDCALKILTALILGTGFGVLGAFFVLSVWTILGKRRPVVPEEYDVQPEESEYKKFSVSADKAVEDGIKRSKRKLERIIHCNIAIRLLSNRPYHGLPDEAGFEAVFLMEILPVPVISEPDGDLTAFPAKVGEERAIVDEAIASC